MSIVEFLEARIAEEQAAAQALLADLEGEVAEEYGDVVDERGPMTPARLLAAKMWALYSGQSRRRSFARGQQIALLASPARVLAECEAKRAIIKQHEGWPVLVEAEPKVEPLSLTDGSCFAYSMSRKIAWFTEREYVKRFGSEPPTAPMIRTLAAVYSNHPDYREGWA